MSEPTPISQNHGYSRAFEALVSEGDAPDIVGLLAYGLFKASIRERTRDGQIVPSLLRNPTTAEIEAYRGRAERILEQYGQGTIAEATPDILESARTSAKADILREIAQVQTTVEERTRAWPAIGYGVAAWFISIFVTVVITFAAPGWVTNLVNRISSTEQVSPRPN